MKKHNSSFKHAIRSDYVRYDPSARHGEEGE